MGKNIVTRSILVLTAGFFAAPLNADNMFFTCGAGVAVPITPNLAGEYILGTVACGGTTFTGGKGVMNDSGDPSDLIVSGTWTLTGNPADIQPYTFTLGGYTQPNPGPAVGWHELHGYFNVLGAGGSARLDASGTLNGVATPAIFAFGVRPDGGGDIIFNVVGPKSDPIDRGAGWTRSVTYTPTFAGADTGSRIVLPASGESPFSPVPEPTPAFAVGTALFLLATVAAFRRAKHSA